MVLEGCRGIRDGEASTGERVQCLPGNHIFLLAYIHKFVYTAFNIGVSGGLYAGGKSLSLPSKPDFHCEDKAAAVWLPAFHSIHDSYFAEVNCHGISTGRSKKRSGRPEMDDS